MEFIFNGPAALQSPLHSLSDKGKKRRSFGLDDKLDSIDSLSPPSSPVRAKSKPRLTIDSNGVPRQVPGWATPPKSPKSPKASNRSIPGTPTTPRSPGKRSGGVKSFGFPFVDGSCVGSSNKGHGSIHSSPTAVSPTGRNRSGSNSANTTPNSHTRTHSLKNAGESDYDRFIPNRDSVDFDMAGHVLQASIIDENIMGEIGGIVGIGSSAGNQGTAGGATSTSTTGTSAGAVGATQTGQKTNTMNSQTSNNRTHLGK